MSTPDLRPPQRILIVRLSALGDVIQTLPIVSMIRQTYPDATIGWLVEAQAAVLLEGNPQLDYVHVSHRKRWIKSLTQPHLWIKTLLEIRAFLKQIHAVKYEVVLDFQGLLKSALVAYATGIPRRVGLTAAREFAPMLYTQKVDLPVDFFSPAVPILSHFQALLTSIGIEPALPQYSLPPVSQVIRQELKGKLSSLASLQSMVVLAPATQWESKHWPVAYWTQLIQSLLETTPVNLVMIGGLADVALSQQILAGLPENPRLLDLTGKTSLVELQALFSLAEVIVGPDSAPLHLAGAVGKMHLIGLYGPTGFRRTPPPHQHHVTLLSVEELLSCQPCDARVCPLGTTECMTRILPDAVLKAVKAAFPEAIATPSL